MKKALFCAVLVISFLFRFVSITKYPVGFNADEASFGYDAYSILHTGRDQWGNFMPLVFKSFGDYKSPVYGYLTVPSVAIFGLNVFATRLPNAIIGTLAVLFVYLLTKELFERYKDKFGIRETFTPALISAFLLAVNPWAVMMSRGAFEANLITFFLPAGIYFFLKGLKHPKFFIWSAVFFGINLFTYHSAKLITPMVTIGLFAIFYKELKLVGFKKLFLAFVIFMIFFIGIIYSFTLGGGARISERSITQGALEEGAEAKIKLIQMGKSPILSRLQHNKYQVVFNRFTTNYFQYFSTKFLIRDGSPDASYGMIPGIGTVNLVEVILFFGIVPLLFLERKSRNLILILLFWLAITPLTSALATGAGYDGHRAEGMLPVLQIIEAFGLFGWVLFLKSFNRRFVSLLAGIFCIILAFEVYGFASLYFKNSSNLALKQMIYGSLEASKWLSENSNGRNVLISRGLTEPQIFVAFANKWNPSDFQKSTKDWNFDNSKLTWVDQLPSYTLGNYTFKSIDPKKDMIGSGLVVVRADEFTESQIPIKTISYPDGTPDIYILDTNQKIYAKTN